MIANVMSDQFIQFHKHLLSTSCFQNADGQTDSSGQYPGKVCAQGPQGLLRDNGRLLKFGNQIKKKSALAGVAHRMEHLSVNQTVVGLIPHQGTCLGCRPGPQLGLCERQLTDVSLHLFLPPFFFL